MDTPLTHSEAGDSPQAHDDDAPRSHDLTAPGEPLDLTEYVKMALSVSATHTHTHTDTRRCVPLSHVPDHTRILASIQRPEFVLPKDATAATNKKSTSGVPPARASASTGAMALDRAALSCVCERDIQAHVSVEGPFRRLRMELWQALLRMDLRAPGQGLPLAHTTAVEGLTDAQFSDYRRRVIEKYNDAVNASIGKYEQRLADANRRCVFDAAVNTARILAQADNDLRRARGTIQPAHICIDALAELVKDEHRIPGIADSVLKRRVSATQGSDRVPPPEQNSSNADQSSGASRDKASPPPTPRERPVTGIRPVGIAEVVMLAMDRAVAATLTASHMEQKFAAAQAHRRASRASLLQAVQAYRESTAHEARSSRAGVKSRGSQASLGGSPLRSAGLRSQSPGRAREALLSGSTSRVRSSAAPVPTAQKAVAFWKTVSSALGGTAKRADDESALKRIWCAERGVLPTQDSMNDLVAAALHDAQATLVECLDAPTPPASLVELDVSPSEAYAGTHLSDRGSDHGWPASMAGSTPQFVRVDAPSSAPIQQPCLSKMFATMLHAEDRGNRARRKRVHGRDQTASASPLKQTIALARRFQEPIQLRPDSSNVNEAAIRDLRASGVGVLAETCVAVQATNGTWAQPPSPELPPATDEAESAVGGQTRTTGLEMRVTQVGRRIIVHRTGVANAESSTGSPGTPTDATTAAAGVAAAAQSPGNLARATTVQGSRVRSTSMGSTASAAGVMPILESTEVRGTGGFSTAASRRKAAAQTVPGPRDVPLHSSGHPAHATRGALARTFSDYLTVEPAETSAHPMTAGAKTSGAPPVLGSAVFHRTDVVDALERCRPQQATAGTGGVDGSSRGKGRSSRPETPTDPTSATRSTRWWESQRPDASTGTVDARATSRISQMIFSRGPKSHTEEHGGASRDLGTRSSADALVDRLASSASLPVLPTTRRAAVHLDNPAESPPFRLSAKVEFSAISLPRLQKSTKAPATLSKRTRTPPGRRQKATSPRPASPSFEMLDEGSRAELQALAGASVSVLLPNDASPRRSWAAESSVPQAKAATSPERDGDAALVRLVSVWTILETPAAQRLDFLARYSSPDVVHRLNDAIAVWDEAATMVQVAENVRELLLALEDPSDTGQSTARTPRTGNAPAESGILCQWRQTTVPELTRLSDGCCSEQLVSAWAVIREELAFDPIDTTGLQVNLSHRRQPTQHIGVSSAEPIRLRLLQAVATIFDAVAERAKLACKRVADLGLGDTVTLRGVDYAAHLQSAPRERVPAVTGRT